MSQSLSDYFKGDLEVVGMLKQPGFSDAVKPFLKQTLKNAYLLYTPRDSPQVIERPELPQRDVCSAVSHPDSPDPRSRPSREDLLLKIKSLLHRETEYPLEMLEHDKLLEADLGVDSVTQAEVLGIVREDYGLPVEKGFRLRDYPTIASWVDYILKRLS